MGSIKKVSVSETQMKSLSSVDKEPHPVDFERFIPWVFREFDILNITVKRINKAEYQPVAPKKGKKPLKNSSVADSISSTKEFMRELSSPINLADIRISAYYDTNGALVEIAFIDCPVPVPREMFMIIQMCLPFHPHLTRITWKGERLTGILVHEMSKILPGSEITDVIFDGCYVPQGNYYLLLDKATKLKYLSLTNCEINDEVCVMIAERLRRNCPAAENLLVLNLSSNRITDVGAEALGRSLRTNRRLLYLNLCNNEITSAGAAHILLPLTKFKLSLSEYRDVQLQKLKDKLAGNDARFKEKRNVNVEQTHEIKEQKSKIHKKMKAHSHFEDIDDQLPITENSDIYLNTVKEKQGSWYSSGNFTLCALNLAFNRLDSATVSRLANVVSYQYRKQKPFKTGLLRVIIEGNPLPETSKQYDLISKYIDLAIAHSTLQTHSHGHMSLAKSRMKTNSAQSSEQRVK